MPRCFDTHLSVEELRLQYKLRELDREIAALRLARAIAAFERDMKVSLALARMANDALPPRLVAHILGEM